MLPVRAGRMAATLAREEGSLGGDSKGGSGCERVTMGVAVGARG